MTFSYFIYPHKWLSAIREQMCGRLRSLPFADRVEGQYQISVNGLGQTLDFNT